MKENKSNTVASILQVYAVINGIAGAFLGFSMFDDFGFIGVFFIAVALAASFAIYAFGEVIQLLQNINDNTAAGAAVKVAIGEQQSSRKEATVDDELPEL